MDRTKLKKIKYSDILTADNGVNYLVMKAEQGPKILKPLELSIEQVKVIRSIMGNSRLRKDIYTFIKGKELVASIKYLKIKDNSAHLVFKKGRPKTVEVVDGIILSLDNGLPIFATEDNLLLEGIYEFFDDFFDDFDMTGDNRLM